MSQIGPLVLHQTSTHEVCYVDIYYSSIEGLSNSETRQGEMPRGQSSAESDLNITKRDAPCRTVNRDGLLWHFVHPPPPPTSDTLHASGGTMSIQDIQEEEPRRGGRARKAVERYNPPVSEITHCSDRLKFIDMIEARTQAEAEEDGEEEQEQADQVSFSVLSGDAQAEQDCRTSAQKTRRLELHGMARSELPLVPPKKTPSRPKKKKEAVNGNGTALEPVEGFKEDSSLFSQLPCSALRNQADFIC